MSVKKLLEVNDVMFKLRHQTAEEKLIITHVGHQLAHSGEEYSFTINEVENIIRVTKELGHSKLFGETFVLETEENKGKYEKDIRLRFIRNFPYHTLLKEDLTKLETLLKSF